MAVALTLATFTAVAQDDDLDAAIAEELGSNAPPPRAATVKTEVKSEAPKMPEAEPKWESSEMASKSPGKSSGNFGGGSDEPNLDFEARLYRIYSNAPAVTSEKWTTMVGKRKADSYTVQPGDTLWDISNTFFGDGFVWSKLWAENGLLENPHKISKGQNLRFVAGDEASGPSLGVEMRGPAAAQDEVDGIAELAKLKPKEDVQAEVPMFKEDAEKEVSPEELQSGDADMDALIAKPDIPGAKKKRPVLTKLPGSFKQANLVDRTGEYDSTGLDAPKPKSLTTPASVIPNSYLAEKQPAGVGSVQELEVGDQFAGMGEIVYIKLNRGANTGEKFNIVNPRQKIILSNLGEVGPIVDICGTVQVLSAIDDDKNVYRASVVHSVNPVPKGALVTEEAFPRSDYSGKGNKKDIELRVIGGELDERRKVIGEHAVLYLDGGKNAGIAVGDILTIQANRGLRKENSEFAGYNRPIGTVKIVKAEPSVSTAIVLNAEDEILIGDRTAGSRAPAGKSKDLESGALDSSSDDLSLE